jgi:hypothetical protein
MEHDTLSRDDVVARHLVGGAVTGGPTTEDFNTINGHYRLTYQVVATR